MPHSDDPTRHVGRPLVRRDATGHINPYYERDLLERAKVGDDGRDTAEAFLQRHRTGEALSEELGEAYVQSATTGEESEVERKEEVIEEELGGPFVTSDSDVEFAEDVDASNIPEATREPFPKTSSADPLKR